MTIHPIPTHHWKNLRAGLLAARDGERLSSPYGFGPRMGEPKTEESEQVLYQLRGAEGDTADRDPTGHGANGQDHQAVQRGHDVLVHGLDVLSNRSFRRCETKMRQNAGTRKPVFRMTLIGSLQERGHGALFAGEMTCLHADAFPWSVMACSL